MRKFLLVVLAGLVIVSLIGCSESTVSVNAENKDDLSNNIFGKDALVEIGGGLYYDSTTRIVYWWNGSFARGSYSAATPSPYYAPNGLPYRYNTETNIFEEINKGE